MWTVPDIGLHQTQTSECDPKGDTRRLELNCTETNPLGSFFIILAIFFHFVAILFILFIYFFFYFWCSNFSFISPSLIFEYSTVPFSPFIIFVTFTVFLFPIFLFQLIMSSSFLPISLLIITFLSFGLLILFFPFPLPYLPISLYAFITLYSLAVDIAVVGWGGCCLFWCGFLLFCFVLPAHIKQHTTRGGD